MFRKNYPSRRLESLLGDFRYEEKVNVSVAPSCLTLCDPVDCSPPGLSLHGILQARTLEWVATPFSRGSSQPRDQTRSPILQADSLQLSHRGLILDLWFKWKTPKIYGRFFWGKIGSLSPSQTRWARYVVVSVEKGRSQLFPPQWLRWWAWLFAPADAASPRRPWPSSQALPLGRTGWRWPRWWLYILCFAQNIHNIHNVHEAQPRGCVGAQIQTECSFLICQTRKGAVLGGVLFTSAWRCTKGSRDSGKR